MNRSLSVAAFVLGAAVVGWVGAGYVGLSALALGMTALIGMVYLSGALELLRFDRATAALQRALDIIPPDLPDASAWLSGLPPALQNAVRLRLEGERVSLPGPALAPYLVGLLVLLGMLGTFLGMVMTLNGAVIALETTSDLQAIRASLAAPVKGLGVAFGTSVAGVAASAMLGLISALVRRARLQVSQALDSRIARELRGFSLAQQRQQAFQAVQVQARTLPALVDTLQAMMAQMAGQHRELHERMLAEQARFHEEAHARYTTLAKSVDLSLTRSLSESARIAGQTIPPLVADTLAGIARETRVQQQQVAAGVQAQLDGASQRLDAAVTTVADTWAQALASQARASESTMTRLEGALQAFSDTFAQRSSALVDQVGVSLSALQAELATRDAARQAAQSETLQAQTSRTLEQVGALLQVATDAPRAAAEVIGELRQERSASLARDAATLDERTRIMETLCGLLESINHASAAQRQAIDGLVMSSAAALERASADFAARIEAESTRLSETSGEVAGGDAQRRAACLLRGAGA